MSRTTPKPFQLIAIESGLQIFTECQRLLDVSRDDAASRAAAISQHGKLLLEAPTGAGKTLIAGHIVEQFSARESVVWFWFAPFKGVTGQTASALRAELPGLRLRELSEDRQAADSRSGDVFVTTWQTVATKVKDSRNVHRPGEQNLTIEELVAALRKKKLRLGVVVDEAHHGFHGDTQAAKFFREVLRPEYTILITATPDDADVKEFEQAMGIAELQRICVSRADAVESGLVKTGIRCAAYFVEAGREGLVDLEATALREGVAAHRKIRRLLTEEGIKLTPLLLVQADSSNAVERVKGRLLALDFKESQIAVHTAKEPDAGLLAIADNEDIEVLVFVMAVALGFDAPRAFTLVSMRASRKEDFGVQLVGRILRVHRKLQGRAQHPCTLPDALRYGYVFLADPETQTALDLAGQRINQIQTAYANVSKTTVAVRVGGLTPMAVQVTDASGQIGLFQTTPIAPAEVAGDAGAVATGAPVGSGFSTGGDFDFGKFFGVGVNVGTGAEAAAGGATATSSATYRYALRAGMPRRFKTVISGPNEVTEEDCARRFLISTRELFDALKSRIKVERKTLDVFTGQMVLDFVGAALEPRRAAKLAQDALCAAKDFDRRELWFALLRKVEAVMREEVMDEADDPEKVKHLLDVLLAVHPELLSAAQRATRAITSALADADDLPPELLSDEPLPHSERNVYGVLPAGLNSWERGFVQVLEHDANNVVRWWHRNLPSKDWSVNVMLPDGRGFYPDFIVGIEGRKTDDGVLLAEPKLAFERSDEIPKSHAEHKAYGRVLVLHLQGGTQWMTVRYDEAMKKPVLGVEFRLTDTPAY